MKILLTEPPFFCLQPHPPINHVFPLGLGYLAAALHPRHEVSFLLPDMLAYGGDPWAELQRFIQGERWDLIGITATSATIGQACRLAGLVKEMQPEACVVLGGSHVTLQPEAALTRCQAIDAVIAGEGETPFALLAEYVASGKTGNFPCMPGLFARDGRAADLSGPAISRHDDLDRLAFPVRSPILGCSEVHPSVYQTMITARGCPFHCIYCTVPQISARRVRERSVQNVLDELRLLREEKDIAYIFFHDSVFTLRRERTIALCRRMAEEGLDVPFSCQTRTDCLDRSTLTAMKAAGCQRIMLGIESGNPDSLRRIGKSSDTQAIRKVVAMIGQSGILATGFFIVGFPWEDVQTMTATIDFAESLGLDAMHLFSALPLPGSTLWEMAGRPKLHEDADFHGPAMNLTMLTDASYKRLYAALDERVRRYNARQKSTVDC